MQGQPRIFLARRTTAQQILAEPRHSLTAALPILLTSRGLGPKLSDTQTPRLCNSDEFRYSAQRPQMLIPLKDLNPRRSYPIVNIALIVCNVGVFFYQLSLPPQHLKA